MKLWQRRDFREVLFVLCQRLQPWHLSRLAAKVDLLVADYLRVPNGLDELRSRCPKLYSTSVDHNKRFKVETLAAAARTFAWAEQAVRESKPHQLSPSDETEVVMNLSVTCAHLLKLCAHLSCEHELIGEQPLDTNGVKAADEPYFYTHMWSVMKWCGQKIKYLAINAYQSAESSGRIDMTIPCENGLRMRFGQLTWMTLGVLTMFTTEYRVPIVSLFHEVDRSESFWNELIPRGPVVNGSFVSTSRQS